MLKQLQSLLLLLLLGSLLLQVMASLVRPALGLLVVLFALICLYTLLLRR